MSTHRPAAHPGDDVALVVQLDDADPVEITRAQLHAACADPEGDHHPAVVAYLETLPHGEPTGPGAQGG